MPQTTLSHTERSAPSRASGPATLRPARSRAGARPFVGFNPMTPHQAAGMRTDPAPSLPVASGTMPVATATADPADEPPGVHRGLRGLRVTAIGHAPGLPWRAASRR